MVFKCKKCIYNAFQMENGIPNEIENKMLFNLKQKIMQCQN